MISSQVRDPFGAEGDKGSGYRVVVDAEDVRDGGDLHGRGGGGELGRASGLPHEAEGRR
ncbi:hypothetical protein [Streptomyces sp. NPDC058657]|uniref:hypothetical protein n=1 Tax=Streptomyces sp. NPDC058657 TaxID=3346579 RepID=UPI00365C323C